MRGERMVIQLPEHLIDSLRVLFDIFDTSRAGFIHIQQVVFH